MAEKKKYKVLSGKHVGTHRDPADMTDLNGKETNVYGKGEIVESEDDLIAKFPNKFELVTEDSTKPKAKKGKLPPVELPAEDEEVAEADAEEEAEEGDADAEEEGDEEAEDVTDEFKKAVRADLKVFKTGEVYSVADADEPDKPLKGGDKLETKKDVNTFISKYLTK